MNQLPFTVERIQPILSVKDMVRTRKFYVDLLGFEEASWGTDDFTAFSRNDSSIYFCQGEQGCAGTWLWIGFEGDIYSLYAQLKETNIPIILTPVNYSWALEMRVQDPDGHILRLATEPDYNLPFADRE